MLSSPHQGSHLCIIKLPPLPMLITIKQYQMKELVLVLKGRLPLSVLFLTAKVQIQRLKSFLQKKIRGGGSNTIDWNSTMLQITYFRLVDIGDPSNFSICAQHWKEWYHYDYNMQKSLGALSQKVRKKIDF